MRGQADKSGDGIQVAVYSPSGAIARGHYKQEIVNRLHITLKSVSNHISNIFNKLQVVDRAQAIVKARDAGI